jgi:hypothetical protein
MRRVSGMGNTSVATGSTQQHLHAPRRKVRIDRVRPDHRLVLINWVVCVRLPAAIAVQPVPLLSKLHISCSQ